MGWGGGGESDTTPGSPESSRHRNRSTSSCTLFTELRMFFHPSFHPPFGTRENQAGRAHRGGDGESEEAPNPAWVPESAGGGAPLSCRTVRRGRETGHPGYRRAASLRADKLGARRGARRGTLWVGSGGGGGNEAGARTPRGRYLQQHGTNQRVDGPGAGVAHALEAPEHEPALRENGEEVEHGGGGRGARPAPGAEATIAPTSCCARRGTRHTSGPGNQLGRTSAQSSGIPHPPAPEGAQQ